MKSLKLWNKAENIKILLERAYLIPETFIIHISKIEEFNTKKLKDNKKYILRPSFLQEDGDKKSYAGFFKSLFPLKKREVINILSTKNKEEIFWWKGFSLASLIIQEFIETNIYGVYFTRYPNNILEKWFYEIGNKNDSITKWNETWKLKLNFWEKKELEILWKKLENLFSYPQDIEFCFYDKKIYILQTRPITTGNNLIYNFKEIQEINGIYKKLDFDEFWEKPSVFTYSLIKEFQKCLLIWNNIYFKVNSFPTLYLDRRKRNTPSKNLNTFFFEYKKYLFIKNLFSFLKIIILQKLDKDVLKNLFKDYYYSFDLFEESNLSLSFSYKTNSITKFFLICEKQKNKSFYFLEKFKKEIQEKNTVWKNINFLTWQEYFYKEENEKKERINMRKNLQFSIKEEKIIFLWWMIINRKKEKENRIYKGHIEGILVDNKSFTYTKNKKQILFLENLDRELYDKIKFLSWVIVKNGNSLSHNAIILREYKIPSIMNYKDFENLKIWEKIFIE